MDMKGKNPNIEEQDLWGEDFTLEECAHIDDMIIQATQDEIMKPRDERDSSENLVESSQPVHIMPMGPCADMLQAEKSLAIWKKETKRSHAEDVGKDSPSKRMAFEKPSNSETSRAPSQSQRLLRTPEITFPNRSTFHETFARPAPVPMEVNEVPNVNVEPSYKENFGLLMRRGLPYDGRREAISAFVFALDRISSSLPRRVEHSGHGVSHQAHQKNFSGENGSGSSATGSTLSQSSEGNFSSLLHILSILSLPPDDIKWDFRTIVWAMKSLENYLDNFTLKNPVDIPNVCSPLSQIVNLDQSGSTSCSSAALGNDRNLLAVLKLLKVLVDGDGVVGQCIVEESYSDNGDMPKQNIQSEMSTIVIPSEESQCSILSQLLNLMSTRNLTTESQGIVGLELLRVMTNILMSCTSAVFKFKDIWSVQVSNNYCTLLLDGMLFIEYVTMLSFMAHSTTIFNSITFHRDDSCIFAALSSTCSQAWKKLELRPCIELYQKFLQFLITCISDRTQTVPVSGLFSQECKCSFEVPKSVARGMYRLFQEDKICDNDSAYLIFGGIQTTVSFLYQLLRNGRSLLWYSWELKTSLAYHRLILRCMCMEKQSQELTAVFQALDLHLEVT